MRAVIQQVTHAEVDVLTSPQTSQRVAQIRQGLMVLLGITHSDTTTDVNYIADKIAHLRLFPDTDNKMNLSVQDIQGDILLVSQFTLYGDTRHGRRPSFTEAATPDSANTLYLAVADVLRQKGLNVQTGQFRSHMQVSLTNDGPTTFLLDSHKQF